MSIADIESFSPTKVNNSYEVKLLVPFGVHLEPRYTYHTGAFTKVLICKQCHSVGDFASFNCPSCGHNNLNRCSAKWDEDYKVWMLNMDTYEKDYL